MSNVCKLLTVQGNTAYNGTHEELTVTVHADGALKKKTIWRRHSTTPTSQADDAIIVSDAQNQAQQFAWKTLHEEARICSLFFVAAHQVGKDAIQQSSIWTAWHVPSSTNHQQYILFDPVTRSMSQSIDIDGSPSSSSTKIVQPPITTFADFTKCLYVARLIGNSRKQTRVGIAALRPTSVLQNNWAKADTFILPLPFGTSEDTVVVCMQVVAHFMIVLSPNLQVAVLNLSNPRMMLERVFETKSLIGKTLDVVAGSARVWVTAQIPLVNTISASRARELPLNSLDSFRLQRQNTLRHKYFSLWLRKTVDHPSVCVDGKVDNRVLIVPVSMLCDAAHFDALLDTCRHSNVVIWLMIASHNPRCNAHALLRVARQLDKWNVITNVFVMDVEGGRVYLREVESRSVVILAADGGDVSVQFHGRSGPGFSKVRLQVVCTNLLQIVNWLKRLEGALCSVRFWPLPLCVPSLRKEKECTGDGHTFVTVFRTE